MGTGQPMTALVEFQIRKENATMQEWLTQWEKRAQDACEAEPETSAYAAAISTTNDSNVLVYERYAKGRSSLELHMERPANAELTAVMGERRMTKRRVMSAQFADISGYGWWGRPETHPADFENMLLVVIGLRFGDDESADGFIGLSSEHAAYCREAEPDTLIYSAGLATADSDRGDIEQGDFICVMGCTDMAAMQKHSADPNHLALGGKIMKLKLQVQPTFSQIYRTTGKGFLWRA